MTSSGNYCGDTASVGLQPSINRTRILQKGIESVAIFVRSFIKVKCGLNGFSEFLFSPVVCSSLMYCLSCNLQYRWRTYKGNFTTDKTGKRHKSGFEMPCNTLCLTPHSAGRVSIASHTIRDAREECSAAGRADLLLASKNLSSSTLLTIPQYLALKK